MCRFALYLGPPIRLSALVTEPSNSIIHQSYDAKEREEPLNGDGFGVAWYRPELREAPAVFKSVTPAWNNVNLLNLAPVTVSRCLLAHVRAATPGLAVTQLNCHPFVRGRLAFMHNGAIAGFHGLRRRLQQGLSDRAFAAIQGSTDSEHILALIADAYDRAVDAATELERMASAVEASIREVERLRAAAGIDEPSFLNLALTDGVRAVVSRYVTPGAGAPPHSLYSARGRLVIEEGEGRLVDHEEDEPAVLIASEPLGPRRRWEAVPFNTMVLADGDGTTTLRPLVDEAR